GAQLQAEVAHLALAALAVLAGTVGTAVHGAVRTAPDILAHAAVEFMLGALALRHQSYSNLLSPPLLAALQPGIAPHGPKPCAVAASPGCGTNRERRPWPLTGEKSTGACRMPAVAPGRRRAQMPPGAAPPPSFRPDWRTSSSTSRLVRCASS